MTPTKETIATLCLFVNFLARLSRDKAITRIVIAGSSLVVHLLKQEKVKEAEEVVLDVYSLLCNGLQKEGVGDKCVSEFLARKDVQTEFRSAAESLGVDLSSVSQELLGYILQGSSAPMTDSFAISKVGQA